MITFRRAGFAGAPRYCNCVAYALWRWATSGEGSVRIRIVEGKLRCWYVLPDGSTERWDPIEPRRGFAAWRHALWFEGKVRFSPPRGR